MRKILIGVVLALAFAMISLTLVGRSLPTPTGPAKSQAGKDQAAVELFAPVVTVVRVAQAKFVETVLARGHTAFRQDFVPFARRVARWGTYNSLAQLAIKSGAPGVPDFYQGTELWDFSLVDPDNRRPVDYGQRMTLLRTLCSTLSADGDRRPLLDGRVTGPPAPHLRSHRGGHEPPLHPPLRAGERTQARLAPPRPEAQGQVGPDRGPARLLGRHR